MTFFIHTPMVNVNEDQAMLVEWFKTSGDHVHRGELLCALETTKTTFDLAAENEGYFEPIIEAGQSVKIGQIIAVLTLRKGETFTLPPEGTQNDDTDEFIKNRPERRWTKKAEILAARSQLKIEEIAEKIGSGEILSENDILQFIAQKENPGQPSAAKSVNQNTNQRILIIGAGNVAVLVLDILTRIPNQTAIGIVDDNPKTHSSIVMGCPVLGDLNLVKHLWQEKKFDAAALAVGALPARTDLFNRFTAEGIPFANIIDPSAVIGSESTMGGGNMIMAFCRLGPECSLGNNNFLSAYVNIEHHNIMGDHCTFGPNVFMSGGVNIGDRVRFGTGISIEPRLTIGSDVTIASGVVLTTHVPANTLVRNKSNFTFTNLSRPDD